MGAADLVADVRRNLHVDGRSPAISVVIATFNRPDLVRAAVLAVSSQDCSVPFELVVVDDGSTAPTWERLLQLLPLARCPVTAIRLARNRGRSVARNVALQFARGSIVAITDDDCVPTPRWLEAGSARFADPRVGVVQGRTAPCPDQPQPLFSHFIETGHFDGSFSTSNILYRREAVVALGGFDPSVTYWEDADLGWRVVRAGWRALFAPAALVHHQVVPLSLWRWLTWPLHFSYMPAKVARYPELRRHLFLGLWVDWFHAVVDLAVLAVPLGALVHRGWFGLALPYAVAFPLRHGVGGRWPLAKAALHAGWDLVSAGTLMVASLRHRCPVL